MKTFLTFAHKSEMFLKCRRFMQNPVSVAASPQSMQGIRILVIMREDLYESNIVCYKEYYSNMIGRRV